MADTAYISQITLPDGNTYLLKDTEARNLITSNGSFRIAWNGTGNPTAANIPAGVTVNGVAGTLVANESTLKDFYLVYSPTQVDGKDVYDEYVTVKGGTSTTPTYTWEKIGDTQISLSNVVTGVTLNKATANVVTGYASPATASVIGANSTFTVTQPTITVTPNQTYIKASASGGAIGFNATAATTVVTGYTPSSTTFITGTTLTTQNLETTSIKGVGGTTAVSKVKAGTSQTTLKNATNSDTSNNAWLKGWSVANETLTINGVQPQTQTTTQITIETASITVATASANNTTVATGAISAGASGGAVGTAITSTCATAVTALGTPATASVAGATATFKITTQPTITLATDSASATGRVQVATSIKSTTATGGNVAWNSKDAKTVLTGLGTASTATVLTSSTTLTVTKAQ